MDNIKDVTIGYELPKERWLQVSRNIGNLGHIVYQNLLTVNRDGKEKQAAEELKIDIELACMALIYVANCATDKCRLVPMPDKED